MRFDELSLAYIREGAYLYRIEVVGDGIHIRQHRIRQIYARMNYRAYFEISLSCGRVVEAERNAIVAAGGYYTTRKGAIDAKRNEARTQINSHIRGLKNMTNKMAQLTKLLKEEE